MNFNDATDHSATATLNALRQGLVQSGLIPAAPPPPSTDFPRRVAEAHAAHVDETTNNPEAGKARGQLKKSLAAGKHASRTEVARRIARELAEKGPVTIDDVTYEMRMKGMESVAQTDPKNPRNWKGSVFTTGEWRCVGEMPSRIPANNGRVVKLWALKSWLAKNSLHGTNLRGSAFHLAGLYASVQRELPGLTPESCCWALGDIKLSPAVASEIDREARLYGAQVKRVRNAMGALVVLRSEQCAGLVSPFISVEDWQKCPPSVRDAITTILEQRRRCPLCGNGT